MVFRILLQPQQISEQPQNVPAHRHSPEGAEPRLLVIAPQQKVERLFDRPITEIAQAGAALRRRDEIARGKRSAAEAERRRRFVQPLKDPFRQRKEAPAARGIGEYLAHGAGYDTARLRANVAFPTDEKPGIGAFRDPVDRLPISGAALRHRGAVIPTVTMTINGTAFGRARAQRAARDLSSLNLRKTPIAAAAFPATAWRSRPTRRTPLRR